MPSVAILSASGSGETLQFNHGEEVDRIWNRQMLGDLMDEKKLGQLSQCRDATPTPPTVCGGSRRAGVEAAGM